MSVESCSPVGSDELDVSSGDEHSISESMDNESNPAAVTSPLDKVPCQICRLQTSAVIYFNVPVCSGCRAFFRRSVKKGKSYQCLNSRLCGKNLLVPNRRVCKYCRFDRCVKAGMLDAKLRLQNRLTDITRVQTQTQQVLNFNSTQLTLPKLNGQAASSSSQTSIDQHDVLSQLHNLKMAIRIQRACLYGNMEPRESPSGAHDLQVNLNEYVLFNQMVGGTSNLFSGIEPEDWNILSIFEYSMWWSLTEQAELTVRNFGQELQRSYNLDRTYTSLNSSTAREHWKPIYDLIDPSSNRDSVYDVLVEYINGLQITTTNSVSAQLAKAHLDDKEMSALLLLLMTRPACMEVAKSEKSRQALKELRNRTLDSLAAHLKSVGKNVDERMGQIIFLTSDFQNLGRLIKHSIRLLMTATNYKAAPKEFLAFFEQQLDIYNKYAVF